MNVMLLGTAFVLGGCTNAFMEAPYSEDAALMTSRNREWGARGDYCRYRLAPARRDSGSDLMYRGPAPLRSGLEIGWQEDRTRIAPGARRDLDEVGDRIDARGLGRLDEAVEDRGGLRSAR